VICFLSGQFSSKEKIHESLWTEIWKSTTGPLSWPSSCFPAKKKAVASLTTWSGRAFLNTVQLHPLWVKHYQPDREDNQAVLVGLPVGEGNALVQGFVTDLWAVESSSLCRKSWKFIWVEGLISAAGSTGRRNQFAESSPFNYSCSSAPIFPKGSMLTGPRKGAPLFTPFTQASLCLDGGLITVGENHNAFNGKEFNMAANYIFNLFEQNCKDP